MDLDDALLAALTPVDGRERLRQLLVRGWTAVQVFERLPDAVRRELSAGPENETVAARQAVDRVHRALIALSKAGKVQRRRVTYGMFVNTKGTRGMIVDVFRR